MRRLRSFQGANPYPIALIPRSPADTVPRAGHPKTVSNQTMDAIPPHMRPERSFQGLILTLQRYWADYGCVILQPYDMEVGAGTFHPATTLRALGPTQLTTLAASMRRCDAPPVG